ncbi:MAG: AAA family ATPase, partial [Planctomycetota bacterium]
MLIRALRAENFLRFSSLRIENVPPEGLIGIEGPNESGKTTIGEAILFALFGKTRLAVESPVLGLIRWGADAMSAEVEFSLRRAAGCPEGGGPAEGEYLIYRRVDRYGTNHVKIVSLPERAEVAAGNLRVSEFLARNVGFDAAEFQRSFYHDQYEIRRVEREQVAFFETATGIAHLLRAARAVRQEMEPLEREFSYYQKEIGRNRSQIEKHAKNAAKLPDLTSRLGSLEAAIDEMRSIASQLEGKSAALLEDRSALEARIARLEKLEGCEPEEAERVLAEADAEEARASPRLEALLGAEDARGRAEAIREHLGRLLGAAKASSALVRRIAEERAHVLEEERREAERRSRLEGDLRGQEAGRARRFALLLAA